VVGTATAGLSVIASAVSEVGDEEAMVWPDRND
jgi:hypothetical protein